MARGRAPACVALVAGLVALAAAVAVTLSRAPVRQAGSNDVEATTFLRIVPVTGGRWCQDGELLPDGTASARLWLQTTGHPGPAVRVTALAGGRTIASGTQAAGWSGTRLAVALRPALRRDAVARVCVALAHGARVAIVGAPPRTEPAGARLPAQMRIEYLRAGRTSWWAFAGTIADRMGLGHAWSGPTLALAVAALALAAAALSVRELARPRAAWLCALVGVLNALAWSLLLPPFQLPDEPAQYAYAEHVAQTGAPPAEHAPNPLRLDLSPDERIALRDLRSNEIGGHLANAGLWTRTEQDRLQRDLHAGFSRRSDGYSFGATPQPPLYYALAAIPYRVADGGTLLQRLALMRVLSSLLGGLTVLFAFLFLREALPRSPWLWTVGALGVALQPMLASLTSGVNPDALLFCVSAALFWCVARAFRHGLTPRLAAATGAVVAVGLLGKLNVIGLLPGAAAGLVLVALRARRAGGAREALRLPALAAAIALAPTALLAALNRLAWHRPAIGLIGNNGGALSHGSLGFRLNYLWQAYLPRLPGMPTVFPAQTTREYFYEFVGSFGGIDTHFPRWLENAAFLVAALVVALAVRALAQARDTLRARRGEVACYALMALGLLALVDLQDYAFDTLANSRGAFLQVRYLLPLMPLYGALLVLAARGAGRRALPVAGTLLVVLALAHDVLGQLLSIGRFYA